MQEYNLLVGSCLLFATLFAVMYCTRHVDWYALGEKKEREVNATKRFRAGRGMLIERMKGSLRSKAELRS